MTATSVETIADIGVPDTTLVRDVTAFIREAEDDLLFDHSRRGFLFEQGIQNLTQEAKPARWCVTEDVLQRAFKYWKNIDKETGDNIEAAVRNGSPAS
jgi:hypothetical protein